MTQPAQEPSVESNPPNPKRGYAPSPERIPFTIKGASETALRAELANLNPDLRDRALGLRAGRSLATSIEDRGYHYTEIEKQALERGRTSEGVLAIPIVSGLMVTQVSTGSSGKVTQATPSLFDSIVETITPSSRSTTYVIPYETTTPTEITTPYSKTTSVVTPYSITTPSEKVTPTATPVTSEYPWEKAVTTQTPTDIITPIPPLTITPLVPTTFPSLGSGGGGSSGSKSGFSRAYTNRFLYGQGVGILDFSSGLNFGRSVPRRATKPAKRSASTGKINFRGRGR